MSASCSTGLSLNDGVYHFFLTSTMSYVSHGINRTPRDCPSPDVASSLKAPILPTKPCCYTSVLVGRAYMALSPESRRAEGRFEDRPSGKKGFGKEVLAFAGPLRVAPLAIEVVSTSEPSGNRCWNPAVQYASGHIDFRRTHAAVSAPRACGLAAKASAHRKLFSIIPAGIPLQGIVNDTRRTPKVSLERLILLVDYIGTWQCLPNISPWVLHIVQTAVQLPPPEVR